MIEQQSHVPKVPLSRRFIGWIKHHQVWSLIILGVILIAITGGIATALLLQKPKPIVAAPIHKPKPKPAPIVYYSLLDGTKVSSAADQTAPVTGIMIENSPDARPQSGLKQAQVVYEAIAEGGITRFLALYQQNKPQLIGPVRSVRLYDLDYLAPYQAGLAHVGGSMQALQTIRSGGAWRDLDEFFNGSYYWRSTDRYAPHNVYTSFAKLDALNQAKGYTSSTFTSFPRIDAAPSAAPNASQVTINFSSALYNTSYQWDKGCDCYARSQAGAPHLDREDGQITPAVVVALHVDETTILQDGYREQVTTTGTGEADIFQNGTATKATWRKDSQTAPLELIDGSGKAIPLIRGQTWIAVVPNNGGSISWQ